MGRPDELVCLGAIAGAFGVAGEVRLKSFCAEPERIAEYGPLRTEDGRDLEVLAMRPIKGAFAARLSEVSDRDAAEALKSVRLYAPRDRLPPLDEDEYYHADLVGLIAVDTGGRELGRINAVRDHGAGVFLEVARSGASDLLVPFTRAAAPTVDISAGRVVLDPPEEIDARND